MNWRFFLRAIIVGALVLGWGAAAGAESARSLVARGNSAYAGQRFDEALKLYEQAAALDPQSPEIQYDLGNARYKLNDLEGAAAAYQEAVRLGGSPELISRSEFNLGNTAFRQGEAVEASDQEAAIKALEESVGHFRAALDRDQTFTEAGRNLEVSKKRLRKVQEELQKQQAAKEEAKRQQQEMAKDLEEMADQQQAMADQSREQAGGEQADNQALAEQAAGQKDLQDKTAAMAQQLGQSPDTGAAAQDLEQASQKQQEAQEKLAANQPEEAAQAQDEAAAKLRQARERLPDKEQGEQEGQQAKDQPQDNGKEDGKEGQQAARPEEAKEGQAPEEASGAEEATPMNQTAQDLLNEEKQNMIRRQSQQATGYEPVDKDW